jgi:hypothetical protein
MVLRLSMPPCRGNGTDLKPTRGACGTSSYGHDEMERRSAVCPYDAAGFRAITSPCFTMTSMERRLCVCVPLEEVITESLNGWQLES